MLLIKGKNRHSVKRPTDKLFENLSALSPWTSKRTKSLRKVYVSGAVVDEDACDPHYDTGTRVRGDGIHCHFEHVDEGESHQKRAVKALEMRTSPRLISQQGECNVPSDRSS
jgi:hypothetical protein